MHLARRCLAPVAAAALAALPGCPTDPDPPAADDDVAEPLVADLQLRLHEDYGSLVYASWTQLVAGTGRVEYRFDEGEWLAAPDQAWSEGPQEQLLLGIPYGESATVRIAVDGGAGEVASEPAGIDTDPVPAGYLMPQLRSSDPARHEPAGRYLLGSVNVDGAWEDGRFWIFIHDRKGRLVWAQQTPSQRWTLWASVGASGDHLVWDELEQWPAEGETSRLHRMTLDGTELERFDVPGAHHAFAELPDGTILYAAYREVHHAEAIVERSPDGGERIVFDCDAYMTAIGDATTCSHNALFWHEPTDTLLYSLYTHDAVLEIDRASGDVLRVFGGSIGTYAFDPIESTFEWQHGVSYTDAGTLLLSTHASQVDYATVVREYEVDDAKGALVEVWSFGEDDGIVSFTNGDAHRLPGGNTLHALGDSGRVREVTHDGEVVWDLDWTAYHLIGRTVLLEDLYALVP